MSKTMADVGREGLNRSSLNRSKSAILFGENMIKFHTEKAKTKKYNEKYRKKHREEMAEYSRNYCLIHKEQLAKRKKLYIKNNIERIKQVAHNYYYAHRKERLAYQHKYFKKNKKAIMKTSNEWRRKISKTKLGSQKIRAWKLVYKYKTRGVLNPKPCQICGNKKSQAHHLDYSKPLQVVWLCGKHHQGAHCGQIKTSHLKGEDMSSVLEGKPCPFCGRRSRRYYKTFVGYLGNKPAETLRLCLNCIKQHKGELQAFITIPLKGEK